jgi:hypothetical protein
VVDHKLLVEVLEYKTTFMKDKENSFLEYKKRELFVCPRQDSFVALATSARAFSIQD